MRIRMQASTLSRLLMQLLLTASLGVLFNSCVKDKCQGTITYTAYVPVRMAVSELRSAFKVDAPKPIHTAGKIYLYDHYLLVNEPQKGIHILDDHDPSAPKEVAFLNIIGNVDMAVKGNMLYADNAIDLLAIDITDPAHAVLKSRIENAFTGNYPVYEDTIITGYESKLVTETYADCRKHYSGGPFLEGDLYAYSNIQPGQGGGTPSIGGSMARFATYQDYLYALNNSKLLIFSISDPNQLVEINDNIMISNAETIFPYEDNLFIGTSQGMFIYGLNNPRAPSYISTFGHVQSCDPVVTDGKYAYVTLRSGSSCHTATTNELEVLDISNLSNPTLVKSYPMTNPRGLGIDRNTLFICDGPAGLKVFDASDVNAIDTHQEGTYGVQQYESNDVIPYNNLLIVTSNTGIYQYDYTDPKSLKQLSVIPVVQVVE